jgi:hypothetical protein
MGLSKRTDPFREKQDEYLATEDPRLVTTTPGQYLTITGRSEPGDIDFKAKVKALYRAAQTIERAKRQAGHDFVISKLEVLWWEGGRASPDGSPHLNWKLMVRVPDFVTDQDLATAKKNARNDNGLDVWLETIHGGRCVQVLHLGPLERESETHARMAAFAREQGMMFEGFRHEIYLTNPEDVPPEKMRVIVRRGVVPATAAARL